MVVLLLKQKYGIKATAKKDNILQKSLVHWAKVTPREGAPALKVSPGGNDSNY